MTDSITRQNELYDIISESVSSGQLVTEILKWMGSDEAAHCLEDIATDLGLVTDIASYDEFTEWYNSLSKEDQSLVDRIRNDLGIYNKASVDADQFGRILDIYDLMTS